MDAKIHAAAVDYWRWYFFDEAPLSLTNALYKQVLQTAFSRGVFSDCARVWLFKCKKMQRSIGDTTGNDPCAVFLSTADPATRREVLGRARRAFYGGQRILGIPLDPHYFNPAYERALQQATKLERAMRPHASAALNEPTAAPARRRI